MSLWTQLPRPTKIKSTDIRSTTGVIGGARVKESTRSGKLPVRNGKCGKATFPLVCMAKKKLSKLAVAARRAGLRKLGDINQIY
jgi:hypothetical protein